MIYVCIYQNVEIRLVFFSPLFSCQRDSFLWRPKVLIKLQESGSMKRSDMIICFTRKWNVFVGWETHFQLVKLISGGTVTILRQRKNNTIIKQFMNEGRLCRILDFPRNLCRKFAIAIFVVVSFLLPLYPFVFLIMRPSSFQFGCSMWASSTSSSTSSSRLFRVGTQLLEEIEMWHEFGQTMERMRFGTQSDWTVFVIR